MIQAKLADGTVLQFPDGTSDVVVQSVVKNHVSKQPKVNAGLQTARAGLQGMTFGFSDEIGAAAAALAGSIKTGEPFGKAYDKIHQSLQDKREQFSKESPGTALVAEMAGGLATGGLGGAKALGGQAYKQASNLGKLGRISGVGAAEGAVYGAGTADQGDTLSGAATGAALGAAAAPVGAGVVNAIGRGGGAITNYAANKLSKTPQGQAVDVLQETARSIGMTADDAVAKMNELGPKGAIADLDDAFRTIARAGMNRQGTMRGQGTEFVKGRQRDQQKRLMVAIQTESGDAATFRDTQAKIVANRAKQASPLYEAAYSRGMAMTDELVEFIKNPLFESAYKQGKKYAVAEGQGENLLRIMHNAKEVLDDRIAAAMNGVVKNEKGRSHARRLMGIKSQLMEFIGEQSPEYIQAAKIYSDESSLLNALKMGRDILRRDPEELAEMVGQMSEAEKELFRLGGVKAISKMLDKTGNNRDAAARLLQSRDMRDKLGLVMDDPSGFLRQAGIEEQFTQTRNLLTGNSTTASQQEAGRALDNAVDPGMARAIVTANPNAIVQQIVETMTRGKATPEMINELGGMMFRQGMSEQDIRRIFTSPRLREVFGDRYDELVGPYVRGSVAPAAVGLSE